jgi:hypothetical protein
VKTWVRLNLSFEPSVMESVRKAAEEEQRTVTSYFLWLHTQHVKREQAAKPGVQS